MAREFAKRFYDSSAWKKSRAAYIAYRRSVDGGMCETCHVVPGYIVHHKTELSPSNINDPEITLSFNNFKYDCLICHNKEGHTCHKKRKWREEAEGLVSYEFDADGMPIVQSPPKIN